MINLIRADSQEVAEMFEGLLGFSRFLRNFQELAITFKNVQELPSVGSLTDPEEALESS